MTSFRPSGWLNRLFAIRADQTGASPFHAVEIRCTKKACQAARDTNGERYVSAEAPLLPLKQCDRPDQCRCRYQHYEDRRRDSRRVSENRSATQSDSNRVDRRQVKGRRAEDLTKDDEPFSLSEDSYYEYVGNTIRDLSLDGDESAGVDPYNSGRFDKSKSWKSTSGK